MKFFAKSNYITESILNIGDYVLLESDALCVVAQLNSNSTKKQLLQLTCDYGYSSCEDCEKVEDCSVGWVIAEMQDNIFNWYDQSHIIVKKYHPNSIEIKNTITNYQNCRGVLNNEPQYISRILDVGSVISYLNKDIGIFVYNPFDDFYSTIRLSSSFNELCVGEYKIDYKEDELAEKILLLDNLIINGADNYNNINNIVYDISSPSSISYREL